MGTVFVEREGAVAFVRYHHPPRNFLTLRALDELRRCLAGLERDPEVRVIVLGSAVPGQHMLHVEVEGLRALLGQAPPLGRAAMRVAAAIVGGLVWLLVRAPRLAELVLAGRSGRALARNALVNARLLSAMIERSSKVTVCAIDGPCLGGGLELALCCDLRVVRDGPDVVLGLPEVLIGLLPGFGGSQRLARLVGADRALELMLTGRLVAPREAAAMGLVARAIPEARFGEEVRALAARLARRPPLAAQAIKRAVRLGGARSLAGGLALELVEAAGLSRRAETRAALEAYGALLQAELARPAERQRSLAALAAAFAEERSLAP